MYNLRNNCLIGRNLFSGLYINSEAFPDLILKLKEAFPDSIRGCIKRSPIVKDLICHFSPMQHWFVYLTMSDECNWHPSAWTISVCFDRETAKWSSGEEVGPVSPDEWWALLNIWQGLRQKILKITSLVKGIIWHQLICQNSKHSGEAENSVLLDTESFFGDILTRSLWKRPQRCVRPRGWVLKS